MPVYDYSCSNDHWSEAFLSFGDRDVCPDCPKCSEPTKRGWKPKPPPKSATYNGKPIVWYRHGKLRAQWSYVDLVCECGHRERETVVKRGADTAECPECGAEASVEEHSGNKIIIRDELLGKEVAGGWYDIGAGQHFSSKKDRRDWMDRSGFVAMDGPLDQTFDSMERERSVTLRKDKEEWSTTLDRYNNHPDFIPYRQAQDRGQLNANNFKR